MTAKSVARQYANAAFAVAQKKQQVEAFGRDLQAFADTVEGHADLRQAFASVAVPRRSKRDLVTALLDRSGPVADELRRLLDLLADNDRLALVSLVAEAYRDKALEAAGVVKAELVTAQPLGADRQAALAHALGQATGRRVELSGRVDESIIGGVVAKVGSVVYDGSVSRQLERMRQRLTAEG
jgi:F-type H+-transporting ATPase subunit delta